MGCLHKGGKKIPKHPLGAPGRHGGQPGQRGIGEPRAAAGQGKSMRWQAEGNENNGSIMAAGGNKGEEKGWLWQIKRRVSILG